MNLFVIGWNLTDALQAQALSNLRTMSDQYPLLDAGTLWSIGQGAQAFAASVHTAAEASAPRVHVARQGERAVFFDGCPIERAGRFKAHDARALSESWRLLPGALDGQFFAAKVCSDPVEVEIVNDPLGIYHAYYVQWNASWLIGNSVHLLDTLGGGHGLDPLGISLLVCRGWVSGDRTLKDGIRVIPGGQHWSWSHGGAQPHRSTYFKMASLAMPRQRKLSPARVKTLGDGMVRNLQQLSANFGPIRCPITAGRDTRVLLGATLRAGIETEYFTAGDAKSWDFQIGPQIATELGLSHELRVFAHVDKDYGVDAWLEHWDRLNETLVRQSDGMVSLGSAGDALPAPRGFSESLRLYLFGMGGETARGHYNSPNYFTRRHSGDDIKRHTAVRWREFSRPETLALAQGHINEFVDEALAQGFRAIDIPDLFYAYERCRRWAGINYMRLSLRQDVYAPLCDTGFLEAAFSMPALNRYSQDLHYELIKYFAPQLHSFPYQTPWLSRSSARNRAMFWMERIMRKQRKRVRQIRFSRPDVLEAKLASMRMLCFDQKASAVWDFVDRARFERVLSDRASPADRLRHLESIYSIATLCKYVALHA